jgi:hypothetical protein
VLTLELESLASLRGGVRLEAGRFTADERGDGGEVVEDEATVAGAPAPLEGAARERAGTRRGCEDTDGPPKRKAEAYDGAADEGGNSPDPEEMESEGGLAVGAAEEAGEE